MNKLIAIKLLDMWTQYHEDLWPPEAFEALNEAIKRLKEPEMKKPIIAIKDTKIGMFDAPMCFRHVGEAVREFDLIKKDKNTRYGLNPEDFDLYQIATYDETTGEIEMISPYTHLSGV